MKHRTRLQFPAIGCLFLSLSIAACLADATTAAAQWQGNPDVQPVIETRLPGDGWALTRLTDGSFVSLRFITVPNTNHVYKAVFTASADDPLRWTDVALQGSEPPQNISLFPFGGNRETLYFRYQDDVMRPGPNSKEYAHPYIYALSPRKAGRKLSNTPYSSAPSRLTRNAHFASDRIGANSLDSDLHLTIDAGETWNHAYTMNEVVEGRTSEISGLLWLDDARLLITGDRGVIELLAREDGALRRLWTTKLPHYSLSRMTSDGDHVWVFSGHLPYRVSLDTGRIDTSIDPRANFDGAAACHGRLLLWGSSVDPAAPADFNPGLTVWGRVANDPEYTRLQTIRLQGLLLPLRSPSVVGVAELEAPDCLIFMHSGEAVRLNVETGEMGPIVDLHVEMAPWPEYPSPEQVRIVADLSMRLPHEQSMAILREAAAKAAKEGMTPREKTDWVIERMRQEVEALGPAARIPPWEDPTKATREQIAALQQLRQEWILKELPDKRWEALLLESHKPGLTKREQMQWAIERIREALEEQ